MARVHCALVARAFEAHGLLVFITFDSQLLWNIGNSDMPSGSFNDHKGSMVKNKLNNYSHITIGEESTDKRDSRDLYLKIFNEK